MRYIALKNDTEKSKIIFDLAFFLCRANTVDTKQLTPCSPKIDTENTLFL